PKIAQENSTTNTKIIIEDFFPTILEMAGIKNYKTVQKIDGISFINILRGNKTDANERALFWHYPNNWGPTGPGIAATSTIRKGDWKLIYYHLTKDFELFNIKKDIGEKTNLNQKERAIVKSLAKELGRYLRSVDAQMPTDTKTNKLVPWPDEI
ncbi:MAG: DUF4976 domain-containing protein, partial [Flavobacteriaceae bacterium]|nr:DUF4976 domain-containing protein [Flavobacteriaceae bacterium]